MLGTLPDEEVAVLIARPVEAVRLKRTRRGIPTARTDAQEEVVTSLAPPSPRPPRS
jgi:hypothetical protein